MNQLVAFTIFAVLLISQSIAYQEPDLDALAEFCGKESNKKYCDQIAQLAIDSVRREDETHQIQMMQKRKPSFVRFGKRSSSPSEFEEIVEQPMEKRKPSFVRFGRK